MVCVSYVAAKLEGFFNVKCGTFSKLFPIHSETPVIQIWAVRKSLKVCSFPQTGHSLDLQAAEFMFCAGLNSNCTHAIIWNFP